MILAAALCAENKSAPPIELEYAWQSSGGLLPNKGGLRDQPYALIRRMRACHNVWKAMRDYLDNNMDTKWVSKNPDKWKVIVGILDLYSLLDREEFVHPVRPMDAMELILKQIDFFSKE